MKFASVFLKNIIPSTYLKKKCGNDENLLFKYIINSD